MIDYLPLGWSFGGELVLKGQLLHALLVEVRCPTLRALLLEGLL